MFATFLGKMPTTQGNNSLPIEHFQHGVRTITTTKKAAAKPKTAASVRNVKKFNAPQSQDFTISDNSGVIGQVRVKPNAVAWKPKRGKKFHQISLEQLATFAAEHGREVQN